MASVNGHCDPKFSSVREAFAKQLASGEELGASLCVTIDGKPVIDIWGGHSDVQRTSPWTQDTLVSVWSVSKTITALATLILIDRGLLHPNDPVAKHWPEFNTPSKKDILVRHALAHTSGLPSWDPPISTDVLYNVPLSTEKLIAQEPWWTPGTASGYHLVSHGHLLGGIVERVSGKSLQQFIKEELALPRGADFLLPAPESEWSRIAEVVPPGAPPPEWPKPKKGSITYRAMLGSPMLGTDCMTPGFRGSGIGSMAGFANARAVNRILSIITLGGVVDGKRYLSPETVDLIFQEQANGVDLVLGMPIRLGMGFGLSNPSGPQSPAWMPAGKVCFWGGWGGSIAIMDLDRRMTITYAMNRMELGTLGNPRTEDYVKTIYAALTKNSASL